jgi:hypothetical protein
MGQWKKAIPFCNPEVIASVILMMMCVDHSVGMECIAEFQKFISTVGEPCIDEESVDKKCINFK